MIFFATSALYMNDIIEEEARLAGATDIRSVSGGVEFSADLASAYRFCLWSRTATRVLMGLFQDEDILSADELYEASVQIPWEEWVNPNLTFSVTETVKNCPYMNNSHFAAIRLKVPSSTVSGISSKVNALWWTRMRVMWFSMCISKVTRSLGM
jgi:23S rRNA (guanine2445-N2)-methyltransferase / 23S rRNA (guanine2069-N7)-methyltransferase